MTTKMMLNISGFKKVCFGDDQGFSSVYTVPKGMMALEDMPIVFGCAA
jgi:hypothetical protein